MSEITKTITLPWDRFECDEAGADGGWSYRFERFERWLDWQLRPEALIKGSELAEILGNLGCFEKVDLHNLIAEACEEAVKANSASAKPAPEAA